MKVGKTTEFPPDMVGIMGPIVRSAESVDAALAKLNLPEDKILQALFWFTEVTPLDKAALSNITAGDINKAHEILDKKECLSSCWNKGVLNLANNNLNDAIVCLSNLIHNEDYREEFVKLICGETFTIGEINTSLFFN
ncbi:MAG: hypothetical protein SOT07_01465 [Paludibacteraceae bacterium]|nr:hypothetical protein [Paludibacteraceae bacterium]